MPLKLNIGGGINNPDGWTAVDRRVGSEAYPLAYPDGVADELRASHVLEHFGRDEIPIVLADWARVLKPGAKARIAVPDWDKLKNGQFHDDPKLFHYVWGGQIDENDYHKWGFNRASLEMAMRAAGFTDIQPFEGEGFDTASHPCSLNLEGVKGNGASMPYVDRLFSGNIEGVPREQLAEYLRAHYPPDWSRVDVFDARFAGIESRAKNVTSQFGEDGLLEAIFEKIGVKHARCFEVGAADGIFFSNTKALRDAGWSADLIDSNNAEYDKLKECVAKEKNTRTVLATIGPSTKLQDTLWEYGAFPYDLGVIDIDGYDLEAWKAMKEVRPRVIVIERRDRQDSSEVLASLEQLNEVAKEKKYTLIASTFCNAIFVADEELDGPAQPIGKIDTPAKPIQLKVAGVCSLARISWTDMWDATLAATQAFHIPLALSTGAFWGQCLERMLTNCVKNGVDAILTIDYDSVFSAGHLQRLLQIFACNPHIDALAPIQLGRMKDAALFSVDGQLSAPITGAPLKVDTAHFGLTLLRVSALQKMAHPWFHSIPAPDGTWGEGRTDEDISFWRKWKGYGNSLYVDTGTSIGHLEVMVGEIGPDGKPTHSQPSDWRKKHLGQDRI